MATEEELAELRRAALDLALDGHTDQAAAAVAVHDLITGTPAAGDDE